VAVAAAARYAARAARVEGLLSAPEFGETWEDFAPRTCGHRRAMHGIACALLPGCFSLGWAWLSSIDMSAPNSKARAARVEGLLSAPEFGEAWGDFAARTCGH
jgi:hypothetical protein